MKELLFDLEIKNEYILKNFKNSIVLDIETTGLSRKYDAIFLIGIIEIDKNTKTKLLFAENLKEELNLLKSLNLNGKNIITYNGNRFDIPFINSKLTEYNLSPLSINSFDLYNYVNKFKHILNLKSYKQKNIEEFLNINRSDFISGGEVCNNYKTYLQTKNEMLLHSILKHNKDDVECLLNSLEIINYIENKSIFYVDEHNFIIEDIFFDKNFLTIKGTTSYNKNLNYNLFNKNLEIRNKIFSYTIEIREDYYSKDKKCKYILSSDYYDIENKTEFPAPRGVYLLYLNNILFENILNLSKTLTQQIIQ
ncbi:ribonuclease H-like domain-containing protein [Peptoniphilus mikwangii]|uniref:ribonuclease H-like domain-containing protein n=1 Tax=Peptoniphilus mikwangii TaxID=1354300 RepID=UPI000423FA71|nr:ribonuclease H-like domain-containing protein [Peptoniphilus mikwangii]